MLYSENFNSYLMVEFIGLGSSGRYIFFLGEEVVV